MSLFTLGAALRAEAGPFGTLVDEAPREGLIALFAGLILIPLFFLSVYVVPRVLKFVRALKEKGLIEEMTAEAKKNEAAGRFVSAALIYERLKDFQKAALLYEKGGDFVRAAAIYESTGEMERARELYEKSGDLDKSAEASMAVGDFVEAAKTFDRHGDKMRAARALEMTGNRLAAVRAYREAKDYVKAATLLKEEGMPKEAAEMYKFSLSGKVFGTSTIDIYYNYASFLAAAGDIEKEAEVLREISKVDPQYRDVAERLRALGASSGPAPAEPVRTFDAGPVEPQGRQATSLRNIMRTGRMEPRYSFRLWVQILKELDRRYKQGPSPEYISPETIFIDKTNNIDFEEHAPKDFSYISPEAVQGEGTDQISVIYSLGLILYEMITGGLDTVGVKTPREVSSDIPEWLEELTLRCIEKNRAGRYQGLDEIFATLVALKNRI